MSRRRNAYIFCLPLLMMFLCTHVQGLAMEDTPNGRLNQQNCSLAQMSAARAKYDEGIKLINKEYEERRAAFQKAVDLCPSYAEAHNNLADALEHLGVELKAKGTEEDIRNGDKLLDRAEKHYLEALKLKPALVVPRIGLGDVYARRGSFPLAIEQYKKVLKLEPENRDVKVRLEGAERLALPDSNEFRTMSQIIKEAKEENLKKEMGTMGIEQFTVADNARQSFNNILFDGWSSTIKQGEPINQLDEIGKALSSKDMVSYKFVIEGHANTVGDYERNMILSNDRARAVKDYLVKNFNVDPSRIMTQGFGYTRPKHSPETNEKNRRVEVLFLK